MIKPLAQGKASAWEMYLRWNTAFCGSVFPEQQDGLPVYLDMDDSVLESIGSSLGTAADQTRSDFLEAVRATVDLTKQPGDVFAVHLRQLSAWRRRVTRSSSAALIEAPPSIALLATFTLAAEAMGSDQTAAVHAYYPRLAAVFGATGEKEKERLTLAYQGSAEQLWRSLNDWLSLADGRYGIPTAYALTHRYVGLPLSQALIRDGDRRHLLRMFRQCGLPPGSVMTPKDMERVIETWMSQSPCPAGKNLQGLWARSAARERIAELATAELAAWDAAFEDETTSEHRGRAGSIQLVCQVRRFPRASIQLSFVASLPGSSNLERVTVASAEGEPTVDVLALGGSQFRPRSSDDLDITSLVEGILHVTELDGDAEAKRYPRRVVPLRKDEATNTFVECERVQLGEDFSVLVKNDRGLVDEVIALLGSSARPGHVVKTTLQGLPQGWVLITDVQMLAAPPSAKTQRADLNALVPLVTSHLSVAGGLKLPGSLRKWSSTCPPEIRAISQTSTDLHLSMARVDVASGEEVSERTWSSDNGVIIADLAGEELDDGDYELRLSGGGTALQRFVLRLRSSDTPDSWTWSNAPALSYDLRAPWAALTATLSDEGQTTGRTHADSSAAEPTPARAVGKLWWKAPVARTRQITPIVIAAPEPGSCVVTGAHRITLPPTPKGRPQAPIVVGECTQCGLTKRYPAWHKRSRNKTWIDDSSIALNRPKDVDEVKDDAILPDDALDALIHVGGGTASSLDRVLGQVSSSALEVDSLRRALEALGHIEILRNAKLDLVSWRIAPPSLVETVNGPFFLAGAWPRRSIAELQSAVESEGGALTYFDEQAGGLTSWYVEDLGAPVLESLLAGVSEWLPMGLRATVAMGAASQLVAALPPLSAVATTLPRVPLPGAQRISRLDLATASWVPVQTAVTAGAYKMESGFRSRYIFRSDADIEHQEAVLCSAQLAKHLEAQRAGRPLLGHFPSADQLVVPLGADLPVLYGRAAALCSGKLPVDAPKRYATVYRDVPTDVAQTLNALLSS